MAESHFLWFLLLNTWHRLHHYLVQHKHKSHISRAKAGTGRWGRKAFLSTPERRRRKQPLGEIAKEQVIAPHFLLIICSSWQEEQNLCLSQMGPFPSSPSWAQPTPASLQGTPFSKLLCGRISFLFGIHIVEKDGKSWQNTRLYLAQCFCYAFLPVTTKVIYPAPLEEVFIFIKINCSLFSP